MSNNKFNFTNDYSVISVTSINTNTNIIKRPYANTSYSPNKKQSKSDSFEEELYSLVSHKDSHDDFKNFSSLLTDELNDAVKLKNIENAKLLRANFKNSSSNLTNKNDTISNQPSSESGSNTIPIDVSAIYKKIELLNSLKK